MKSMSRLHIYPHAGPRGTVYIAGEPAALQNLAKTLMAAAQSHVGIEDTTLYASDGHEYTITVISNVSEQEWQTSNPPYVEIDQPKFSIVQDYELLKAEMQHKKGSH